jgi:hypothetical protein
MLNIYCALTGYFPDECVGATDEEMEKDILAIITNIEKKLNKIKLDLYTECVII